MHDTDVCGKLSVKSLSGADYFVTFMHDKTKYVWMYVLKKKSEVFNQFCQWKAEVEKSLEYSVKILRSDNGGEYTSNEFDEFLKQEGIKHELTIPKCLEQNRVAEWMNRTLVEKVCSKLADSCLSKSFWVEALFTATYLQNRSTTKAINGMTSYEALHEIKPKVGNLKVFGCAAYSHIPKDERLKLDSKSRKNLGYSDNQKGYRLYDQRSCRVIHSRNVQFNELAHGIEKESSRVTPVEDQAIINYCSDESSTPESLDSKIFKTKPN